MVNNVKITQNKSSNETLPGGVPDRCKVHVQLVLEELLHSLPQLGPPLLHMLTPPNNDAQLTWNVIAVLEPLLYVNTCSL